MPSFPGRLAHPASYHIECHSCMLSHVQWLCELPHYLRLRCQVMIPCLVIKPPHLPSDLHLLHPQWYLHHLPAVRLHQVMWSGSILTHWNCCLLEAPEIQHGIQHEIQCKTQLESQHETWCQRPIVMSLNCWNLTHSMTWNWSQRKMSWIWNFVNDATETETWSDYASQENEMHMINMVLHQW